MNHAYRHERRGSAKRPWLAAALVLAMVPAGCARIELGAEPGIPPSAQTADGPVRNIIFMIGDGMGTGHITAARLRAYGTQGSLNLDRLPVVGHIRTYAANALVTDSAAAGTALSTGTKTDNRRIAMTPDGRPMYTVLEAARDHGMATGLVVTSTITHATPAVFAAHVPNRHDELAIASQLIDTGVDVLLGGGKTFFLPASQAGGSRTDGRNLIEEAKTKGYEFVDSAAALQSARGSRLLGLFANAGMTTAEPEPSLAEMTRRALEILSRSSKGFFIMIEGSQIDWASHKNNAEYTIRQTLLFDDAVKLAVDFALKNRNTLVVVTADHETGGMAINGGALDGSQLNIGWTSKQHTAVDVPVFAIGPRALDFTGVYENTRVPKLFAEYLDIKEFPKTLQPVAPP